MHQIPTTHHIVTLCIHVHISVTNGALWGTGLVHCGICAPGLYSQHRILAQEANFSGWKVPFQPVEQGGNSHQYWYENNWALSWNNDTSFRARPVYIPRLQVHWNTTTALIRIIIYKKSPRFFQTFKNKTPWAVVIRPLRSQQTVGKQGHFEPGIRMMNGYKLRKDHPRIYE